MELIYSACKAAKFRREWATDEPPLCCLSSRNLVAFSTTVLHDLAQASPSGSDTTAAAAPGPGGGHTETAASDQVVPDPFRGPQDKDSNPVQAKYHVYVCDLDKPWEVFHITSYSQKVVALDWHVHGNMLLVALVTGRCQVWSMQNHLINSWHLSHNTTLPGEEVIAIKWLHLGHRVVVNADKRDSAKYSEKTSRVKYLPSLSHFGGRATEGWIAVASTGLVSVAILKSTEVIVKSESLSYGRSRILVSDIAFDSSGDIFLVVSDGSISSAVQCYKITLKAEHGSCIMNCRPMASFYAKCHMDPNLRDSTTARITHLDYMSKESSDILIVGAGDVNNSHVELWTLKLELIALHRFYQANATPDSTFHTHRWQHQSSITYTSVPVTIAVPRFPITYSITDAANLMFQYVAIAYKDGSVKLVNKASFSPMATVNLDVGISDNDKVEKKRKVLPYLVNMQQTFTGCCLVGLDQYSCLYLMKAVNTRDPVTQVPPAYIVAMLEYVIMVGYDWWDIIPAIKPGVLETVIQRLSDNFSKQPVSVQEIVYSRFMAMKASLYRYSQGGQLRAADCHCKLMLHSIATLFKSVLRPKAVAGGDVSPAEKLNQNCNKNLDTDIDKVMVTLSPEKKEFVVDTPTLQSLQQLIQWVSDLTLYLLASLPMAQNYATFPGCSILHDAAVLGTLRELLVVIRIWGLICSNCLPHFTSVATNFDSLARMFKLLTKAWLSCKDTGVGDYEEGLLDECCILPSQVIIPPLGQGLFGELNYSSLLLVQQFPLKYTVGDIPDHVTKSTPYVSLPDGQLLSPQKKDIVRQITLGLHPVGEIRACSRCGCMSLVKCVSKNHAIRAWDLRWSKSCVCGGMWKRCRPDALR